MGQANTSSVIQDFAPSGHDAIEPKPVCRVGRCIQGRWVMVENPKVMIVTRCDKNQSLTPGTPLYEAGDGAVTDVVIARIWEAAATAAHQSCMDRMAALAPSSECNQTIEELGKLSQALRRIATISQAQLESIKGEILTQGSVR